MKGGKTRFAADLSDDLGEEPPLIGLPWWVRACLGVVLTLALVGVGCIRNQPPGGFEPPRFQSWGTPAWSPVGDEIAFDWNDNGVEERVGKIKLTGGEPKRLVDRGLIGGSGAWNPGAQVLVNTNSGNAIVDPQTGRLDSPKGIQGARDPAWSPDRSRVVGRIGTDFETPQLVTTRVDAAGFAKLTDVPGIAPVWSPDGSRIAFCKSAFLGDRGQIYVVPAGGGPASNISNNDRDECYPSWSPDSSRLVFRSVGDDRRNELVISEATGANRRMLLPIGMNGTSPAWSPDGREVAYASDNEANASELRIIDIDGKNDRRLGGGTRE